jgi:NSS family neurotransmitter:Na+ symporter
MNTSATPVQRDHWASRGAFILAAIGSAVGLGNLWGFPYKLYTYGGGAFLIPYFLAMIVMGVPLLIMEFSVGHWAQQSPPGAFKAIMKKYRFVGWWLVVLAFVIITYYTVILGYCVNYLWESLLALFGGSVPWAGAVSEAQAHFGQLIGAKEGVGTYEVNGFQWIVLLCNVVSWVLIYLCLFRGVQWVSKVVLFTVPLPWLMLVILTIRGVTLEGAVSGLEFYLEPRWDKLADPTTWRFAFGQVFFSMSLGFAVMLSYASFLHRRSDLNNNALIIGLGDLATSFIAGIAVFATIGGMSLATGLPVEDATTSGPGLAFVAFPYALAKLPATAVFSAIFFVALLTLGIDSAFSIVEACLASVCDVGDRFKRDVVLPLICLLGLAIGTLYTFGNAGLNILGLADGLINGPFGILLVAIAECVVVGWAWNGQFIRKMRQHANERSDWKLYRWWDFIIRFFAPAMLAILFAWSISGEVHTEIDKYHAAPRMAELASPDGELNRLQNRFEQLRQEVAAPQIAQVEQLQQSINEADAENRLDDLRSMRQESRRITAEIDELLNQAVAARGLTDEYAVYQQLLAERQAMKAAGVTAEYQFPWITLAGMMVFVAVPIVGWLVTRGRGDDEGSVQVMQRSGARYGVIYVVFVMVAAAVVIELLNAAGLLETSTAKFVPDQQLSAVAYTILGVAFLVIFGGLAWCFWRAMLAAGAEDVEMDDTAEIDQGPGSSI